MPLRRISQCGGNRFCSSLPHGWRDFLVLALCPAPIFELVFGQLLRDQSNAMLNRLFNLKDLRGVEAFNQKRQFRTYSGTGIRIVYCFALFRKL